jgi:hypothetical protein
MIETVWPDECPKLLIETIGEYSALSSLYSEDSEVENLHLATSRLHHTCCQLGKRRLYLLPPQRTPIIDEVSKVDSSNAAGSHAMRAIDRIY